MEESYEHNIGVVSGSATVGGQAYGITPVDTEPVQPEAYEEAEAVLVEADEEPCCPEQEQDHLPLPSDFPYIGTLGKAGETLDTVILKAQNGTLADVKGMGEKGVQKVIQYLQDTGRLPRDVDQVGIEEEITPPSEDDEISALLEGEEIQVDEVKPIVVKQALAEIGRVKDLKTMKDLLGEYGATGMKDLAAEHLPAIYADAMAILGS